MRISHNLVAVYPDGHFNKVGGFEVFAGFDEERHYAVKGRVLIAPDSIFYTRGQMDKLRAKYKRQDSTVNRQVQLLASMSMEFDTQVEIQTGDEVYFSYMNHLETKEEERVLDIGLKRNVLLVNYDTLFMAKRGEELIMLNGYILVEPIDHSKEDLINIGKGFEVVKKDTRKLGVGVVRYIGSKNKGYMFSNRSDLAEVQVGDIVYYRHTNNVSVEWDYHKTIDKHKKYPYYRMQRQDILAIFRN